MNFTLPCSVNGYELVENIGSGTFGTVYKTSDNKAVKFFKKQVLESSSLRECINSYYVRYISPFVASVRDSFVVTQNGKSSIALVFDYFPESLCNVFEKPAEIRKLVINRCVPQIIEGMRDMHYYNICHRDMKPDNVMIKEENGELVAQIIDFGLSKWSLESEQLDYDVFAFHYRCPEILKDVEVDYKSADMWAIGICVLNLVYGGYLDFSTKQETWQWIKLYVKTRSLHKWLKYNPIFEDIIQKMYDTLLNMDPTKRLVNDINISMADANMCNYELMPYPKPFDKNGLREALVENMWKVCKTDLAFSCFPLAVEIMDRFFTTPESFKTKNLYALVCACVIIANSVCGGEYIYYELYNEPESELAHYVCTILYALNFKVNIITCMHGSVPSVRPVQVGFEIDKDKVQYGKWDMRDILHILKKEEYMADGLMRIAKYEEKINEMDSYTA
ncbi:MAG TPA: protein kinase [Nitrosarchaeum sp.]|nr:protein kinase [Nitrosarchaeum sp.]